MGFRLSSAIAGFATRTSENLDELQNKADDIAKTAAARYADEAIQVRKERMKSRQEYLDAATMLQNNFNLSNNQVESILSGGVANKDLFIQKMKDIEDQQFSAAKATGQDMNTWKFNNNAAISEIFTGTESDTSRDIMAQADLFASRRSPFAAPDMEALGKSISKSTKTLFGSIGESYGTHQFDAHLQAQAGELPQPYEGDGIGFGEHGLTANLSGLTMTDKRAITTFAMTQEKSGLEIEQMEDNIEWLKDMRPEELARIKASTKLMGVQLDNETLKGVKLGYENDMLSEKLKDWRDWGRDLDEETKKAQLNSLIADISASKDVSPTNLLGGLLKERGQILSGKIEFKTDENKKEAIKQLDLHITRTQATISTLYEAQHGNDEVDIRGINTMAAFKEEFMSTGLTEAGFQMIGSTLQYTTGSGKDIKYYQSNTEEYQTAWKKVAEDARTKFKEAFFINDVAMNDGAAAIEKTFGVQEVQDNNSDEAFASLKPLSVTHQINNLITDDEFTATKFTFNAILNKIKDLNEDNPEFKLTDASIGTLILEQIDKKNAGENLELGNTSTSNSMDALWDEWDKANANTNNQPNDEGYTETNETHSFKPEGGGSMAKATSESKVYTKDGKKYYLDNGTYKEIVGSQTETVTEPEFNADKWIKTNEKFLDRELNNYNKNKNKEQAKRILIEQIQGVGFFNRLNKAEATIVANELIGL